MIKKKKDTEHKMPVSFSNELYAAMLEIAHKNKLENIRKKLKEESKKPDTIVELIRKACEKIYLKK